ncbi:MAG: 1-deoxy-D-xylulose-5-phosphate synthase [Coprobacillus sp.]|nr:1-deoxy-D-xylulose-5-phosphate synthase [Coprobacillus sp.]
MEKYPNIINIKSPQDIKNKNLKELEEIAKEIRLFLIESLSKTGGHLASNLGVVEATIAMHYVFESPHDKIIFDVGHQGYVHKILTGRINEFPTLRKYKGLSGFLKYSESEHDVFEAGHSSTSIPAMCGFLKAKELGEDIGEVIAFIGDASFQNGLSFSGLNFLSSQPLEKGIIILNDNEMSISKNTGGLANIFNKIRIRKSYKVLRKITPKAIRNAIKGFVYGNVSLFNQLGYRYIGPIDGHNIKELIKYMKFAKDSKESVILHIKTIKGKGYEYSEKDKVGKFHGLGPFDITTGEEINKDTNYESFGEGVCQVLIDLFKENKTLFGISPAMTYGAGLFKLQEKFPQRFIDTGISEEGSCVMASSLSRSGYIPILVSYATFFQRMYDEINHDITRTNSHVIMLSDRAGIVPGDGDTHQGIFDVSMLMPLPNIVICEGRNIDEIAFLLRLAISENKPFYIRYPKTKILKDEVKSFVYEPYKWLFIKPMKKVNVLSYGPVLEEINEITEGLDVGIINALFIKPFDKELIRKLDNTTLIIYEDIIETSSLGEIIKKYAFEEKLNINIITYSLANYVGTGSIIDLRAENRLDMMTLKNVIIKCLNEK